MGTTLIVTTLSPLAVELVNELAKSGHRYKVYALGGLEGVSLPPGSKVVQSPSYFAFLRFLDANPDISDVVFAAKLFANVRFWTEALRDRRLMRAIILERRIPTAALLLEGVVEDIRARDVTIRHPHWIGRAWRVGLNEQLHSPMHELGNRLRAFVVSKRVARSPIIVPESRLFGVTEDGMIEPIRTERTDTEGLMRSLRRKNLSRFSRVVLYKSTEDNTQITYPVIGLKTIQDAVQFGITDIVISADCVVQGKEAVLRLAEEHHISIMTFT